MLENIVSSIIDKVVGEYVEDLNATDLSISIFQGNVNLKNVRLKKSALDGLDIPVTVSQGIVGKLNLQIPWKNLQSLPMVLELEDVFLVVKPNKCCEWDEQGESEKQRKIKATKISQYETLNKNLKETSEMTEKTEASGWSFFSDTKSMMETIVNNLVIRIHNVHLRYEDTSDENKPLIAGVSLEDLTLQSCDETWEKKFIRETGQFSYKLGELCNLSIYVNGLLDGRDSLIGSVSSEKFIEEMKRLITEHERDHYILQPINGRLQARLQRKGEIDLQTPRYDLNVTFEELSASLDDTQYRHIVHTIGYILNYQQFEQFRSVKPPGLDKRSNSIDWWNYTAQSIQKAVHSKFFTWKDILERSETRTRYVELFKRKRQVPWLPKLGTDTTKEFEDLEEKLDVDDIIFFRQLAEAEIAGEFEVYNEYENAKKTEQRGWFGWITGNDEENEKLSSFMLSEEDRRKLYQSIGHNSQENSVNITVPQDYVQFRLSVVLKTGQVNLVDAKTQSKIIETRFDDVLTDIRMKEDTSHFIVDISLGTFSILDCHSQETRFLRTLSRRERTGSETTKEKSLATLTMESNPYPGTDFFVGITLEELDLVINVPLVQRLLAFLTISGGHADLSAIEEFAWRRLASMQQHSQAQLKMALESKTVFDFDFNIKAPVLILPETCAAVDGTPAVIINFGHMFIKSDIDIMGRKRRIENQEVSESDYYDKFNFGIDSTQIRTCIWNGDHFSEHQQLLENVSIEMCIEKCITPFNDQLPTLKTMGNIPSIALNMSVDRLDMLIKIFNEFSVLIDDPTGANDQILLQVSGLSTQKESAVWMDYFCELRESGSVAMYANKDDNKPAYSISLSKSRVSNLREAWMESEVVRELMVKNNMPASDDKNIFVIALPQRNDIDLVFMFRCPDSRIRSAWIGKLREVVASLMISDTGTSKNAEMDGAIQIANDKWSKTKSNLVTIFQLNKMSMAIQHQQQTISEIVLDGLDIKLDNRNFDNTFSLKLHSISISNLLDPEHEEYIISPEQNAESDLGLVTFTQAKPDSPKFADNADMTLTLQFGALSASFDPIILSRFVLFGQEVMTAYDNMGSRTVTYSNTEEMAYLRTGETSISSSFALTAQMSEAKLVLIDCGATFMTFDMKNAHLNFLSTTSEMRVSGDIGDLIALDFSEETYYKEALDFNSRGHSFINFSFEKKHDMQKETEPGRPYYDKFINVEMHSVKIVYLQRLLNKFQTFINVGPLMDALRPSNADIAQTSNATNEEEGEEEEQSDNMAMVQINLEFISPIVIVPTSPHSADHVVATLGKISVHNHLYIEHVTQDNWMEEYTVQLNEMNLKSKESGRLLPSVDSANLDLLIKQAVKASEREIPPFTFHLLSSKMALNLSHRQYQTIFHIIYDNFYDTTGMPASSIRQQPVSPKEQDNCPGMSPSVLDDIGTIIVEDDDEQPDLIESNQCGIDEQNAIYSEYIFEFPHMDLQLIRDDGVHNDQLALLNMRDFKITNLFKFDDTQIFEARIHGINAFDSRAESKSLFKEFIISNPPRDDHENQSDTESFTTVNSLGQSTSLTTENSNTDLSHDKSSLSSISRTLMLSMQHASYSPSSSMYAPQRHEVDFAIYTYENRGKDTIVQLMLGNSRIIYTPDIITEIRDFFTNRYADNPRENQQPEVRSFKQSSMDKNMLSNFEITSSTWLGEDIILHPQRQMLVKWNSIGEVVINGEGHTIFLHSGETSNNPVIVIEDGMTLKLNNTRLVYVGDLMQYIRIGTSAKFIAPATQGVIYDKQNSEEDLSHAMDISTDPSKLPQASEESSSQNAESEQPLSESETRYSFFGKFEKPRLVFPEDTSDLNSRLLSIEARMEFSYSRPYGTENGIFSIQDLTAFTESANGAVAKNAPIIEPVSLSVELLESQKRERAINRIIKVQIEGDINVRISYQDVLMIKKIVATITVPKEEKNVEPAPKLFEPIDDDNVDDDNVDDDDVDDDIDLVTEFTCTRYDDADDPSMYETAYSEVERTGSDHSYDSGDDDNDMTFAHTQDTGSFDTDEFGSISTDGSFGLEGITTVENSFEISFESEYDISLVIVDNIRGYDVPLLDARVSRLILDPLNLFATSQKITAVLKLSANANFYNFGLAMWEPIVEPFSCEASLARIPLQNASTSFMYKAEVHSILEHLGRSEDDAKDIFKPSTLNFNISKSMIDTVLATSKLWREGFTSHMTVPVRFDPFTIRNHCGQIISFTKQEGNSETVTLSHGEEHGFKFSERRKNKSEWRRDYVIHVKIPGYPLTSMDVHRVDSKMILNESEKQCAILEVGQFEGRKIVTVRSGIKIFNGTSITWNLGLSVDGVLSQFGIVHPQESYGIPISNVNKGTLCIQPTGHESQYNWSDIAKGLSLSALICSNQKTRLFKCKNVDSTDHSKAFHCVAKMKSKHAVDERILSMVEDHEDWITLLQQFDFTVHLRPPLSFENLLGCNIDFVLFDKITMSSKKKRVTSGSLARGEKAFFYGANLKNNLLLRIRLQGSAWKTEKIALVNSVERPSKPLTQHLALSDNRDRKLYLHLEYHDYGDSFRDIFAYCPYWIKNNTGQKLSIRENDTPAAGLDIFETLTTTDPHRKTEPMMLSFNNAQLNNKISIAVDDSKFSPAFSIDNAGITGNIELTNGKHVYNIGVYVAVGPGKFKRTKIVTFAARYVIINRSNDPILIKRNLSSHPRAVHPGEKVNFYWHAPERRTFTSSAEKRLLSINVDEQHFEWSAPFRMDVLGATPLKCQSKRIASPKILNVNLTMEQATAFIIIEKLEKPPYIIENMLDTDIEFSQLSTNIWWIVRAGLKAPFVWDDNTRAQKLRLRTASGFTVPKPIAINRVAKEVKLRTKDGTYLYISVRAEGPIRILCVSNTKRVVRHHEADEQLALELFADIPEIGLSFINNLPTPEEIAYMFLEGLKVNFRSTEKKQNLDFVLARLQLDNMSSNAQFPVMLSNVKNTKEMDFIRVSITRSLEDKTIHMFHYFGFAMQEANLAIDSSFSSKLSLYLEGILKSTDKEDQDAIDKMLASIDAPSSDIIGFEKPTNIYFDRFELHPIKINVTFRKTHAESNDLKKSPLFLILNNIGITLVNVDDAPLKLNSLIMKHAFMTTTEILDIIKQHYTTSILSEIYKIVGSFDILGNPIGLVSDLSTGLKDFFYEPASAIVKSRGKIHAGVIRGTTSLFSSSIHGTFNSASKLTGSMSKALGMLTFDMEYTKEREEQSSRKATNFREGFFEGASAAFKGFVDGSTGLIIKPLEGASKDGAKGFFKGVGIGIIGIPMKPVAGFFDLVTKTTEGISNIGKENRWRKRLARVFGEDGAVIPYSGGVAYIQHMLRIVSKTEEHPLEFCLNENNTIAILTRNYIFNINHVSNSLVWNISINRIASVERESSTCLMILMQDVPLAKQKKPFRTKSKNGHSTLSHKIVNDRKEILDEFQSKLYQRIDKCQAQQRVGETSIDGLLLFHGMVNHFVRSTSPQENVTSNPRAVSFRGTSGSRSSLSLSNNRSSNSSSSKNILR